MWEIFVDSSWRFVDNQLHEQNKMQDELWQNVKNFMSNYNFLNEMYSQCFVQY